MSCLYTGYNHFCICTEECSTLYKAHHFCMYNLLLTTFILIFLIFVILYGFWALDLNELSYLILSYFVVSYRPYTYAYYRLIFFWSNQYDQQKFGGYFLYIRKDNVYLDILNQRRELWV